VDQEPTHAVQHFSQVIESPPGRAAAVPPHRALIRIKKSRNIFWPRAIVFRAVDHSLFLGVSNEEEFAMAENVTRIPVQIQERTANVPSTTQVWAPFFSLRREMDRLFDDFGRGFWQLPTRRSIFDVEPIWVADVTWEVTPAVDVAESEKAYEFKAELPGMDEKNIEVKVANGNLIIKGEKQEEKEEKKKDYYMRERNFGSFERRFEMPEGVDADKIEASFKNGVLTLTLPKKLEVQKPAKKIEVKAA
jgi:HSP20 family protein